MAEDLFARRHVAPHLPDGLEWLNCDGPIPLESLRGKFVLLDFWTYCCINCMHMLPVLSQLEEKYARQLVVIGIHSAKFNAEQDRKNIEEAIARYNIRHPVVNDKDMTVWRLFGVHAWPTFVLIDPQGFVIWQTSGEQDFEVLDQLLATLVKFYRQKNLLDESPLLIAGLKHGANTALRFPGKILADASGERLFVSDSGHNRVIICTTTGKLLDVVGTGAAGREDGPWDRAQFNDPQGLALMDERLYVADRGNHLIREIDLAARRVRTIAGNGKQRRPAAIVGSAPALKTSLASPWDLLPVGDRLIVAMAGAHQLWFYDLKIKRVGLFAGSGREDIVDGRLLPSFLYDPRTAAFAQPSGLATDGNYLYVADSEGSSIRRIRLQNAAQVETLVGTSHLPSARLFTFGFQDGPPGKALFQHPLGLAYYQGKLYVADTYNNAIRVVDCATGTVRTMQLDAVDGVPLNEPGGLTVANSSLFVADTNNHRIVVIDLLGRDRPRTLHIAGLKPPVSSAEQTADRAQPPAWAIDGAETEKVAEPLDVVAGKELQIEIAIFFQPSWQLNSQAPHRAWYKLISQNGTSSVPAGQWNPLSLEKQSNAFTSSIPGVDEKATELQVLLLCYICSHHAEAICRPVSRLWRIPLRPSASDASVIQLKAVLP